MSDSESGSVELASKGEFAAMIKVSPGRISQMIRENKIPAECLEGEGRTAKIRVAAAKAAIAARTDVGQRMGNGAATDLSGARPALSPTDDVVDQIQREKLWKAKAENRRLEEMERERRGMYVRTEEARAECHKALARLLSVVEGGLPVMANDLASKCDLPQRDILHSLRASFRAIRDKASQEAAARSAQMEQYAEDEVDGVEPGVMN